LPFPFSREWPISFNLLLLLVKTAFVCGLLMLRFTVLLAVSLLLAACADTASPNRTPPQDPADYKGVPTDTRPPDMVIAPNDLTKPQ
jgi:hypothetical protein